MWDGVTAQVVEMLLKPVLIGAARRRSTCSGTGVFDPANRQALLRFHAGGHERDRHRVVESFGEDSQVARVVTPRRRAPERQSTSTPALRCRSTCWKNSSAGHSGLRPRPRAGAGARGGVGERGLGPPAACRGGTSGNRTGHKRQPSGAAAGDSPLPQRQHRRRGGGTGAEGACPGAGRTRTAKGGCAGSGPPAPAAAKSGGQRPGPAGAAKGQSGAGGLGHEAGAGRDPGGGYPHRNPVGKRPRGVADYRALPLRAHPRRCFGWQRWCVHFGATSPSGASPFCNATG